MEKAEEKMIERMSRIGSKRNFNNESQVQEVQENKDLIKVISKSEGGVELIDLILEPNKFEELSSKKRLDFDEFCDAINTLIDDEEDDWNTLRMKDQVNMTRDRIIEDTIVKYAKEELNINTDAVSGREISYVKRFGEQGEYIGEAITVSLTKMPQMGITIS